LAGFILTSRKKNFHFNSFKLFYVIRIKNQSMINLKKVILFIVIVFTPDLIMAQSGDLKLLDWQPKSQLVVKETKVLKPKYPVIDIHNHLGNLENTKKYLEEMDKAGVWKCVSLDGNSKDDAYIEHLKVSQYVSEERFLVLFRPDFSKIDEPDYARQEAEMLENAVKKGSNCL